MRTTVNKYFMFMWNIWSYRHCKALFPDRADHIWNIWLRCCEDLGRVGAAAKFWSLVDSGIQESIVELAQKQ